MKKDLKQTFPNHESAFHRRFSVKEFLQNDPETFQWMKSISIKSDIMSIPVIQQEDEDSIAKSVVRGMTKTIDLLLLSEDMDIKEDRE